MGHKSVNSADVYTKVFALDVDARHGVQFQMKEIDALAILRVKSGNGFSNGEGGYFHRFSCLNSASFQYYASNHFDSQIINDK